METTGLRDRLAQEETGKDCKGKARYWLLSCYTCRRRHERSPLQLRALFQGMQKVFRVALKQLQSEKHPRARVDTCLW